MITYRGTCRNLTYNLNAQIWVEFTQMEPGNVRGKMTISEPLTGGGEFSGTIDGNTIRFVTGKEERLYIIWKGTRSGEKISGTYVVYDESLVSWLTGGQTVQTGNFECAP